MKCGMLPAVLTLAFGLAIGVNAQMDNGKIVVVKSSEVAVMNLGGSDVLWEWTYPAGPAEGAWAQVFPDGNGSHNVLVVVPGVGSY